MVTSYLLISIVLNAYKVNVSSKLSAEKLNFLMAMNLNLI
jgi:hypothetical protein